MRSVIILIICCCAVTGRANAQSPLDEDMSRFGRILTELKLSADQLSKGNTALSGRNNELRGHLNQWHIRMQKLTEEHGQLLKASEKLQAENPAVARKIERLENDAYELGHKIEGLAALQRASEATIKEAREESERLAKRLVEVGAQQPAMPPQGSLPDPGKEKLRLLKMIDDSKEKQAYLYRQMANAKQNLPMSSIVSVQVPKDKDSLINQSRQLQEEVDQLTKMANQQSANDVDEAQMRRLQEQIDVVQRNHDELADLVTRMQQKVQKTVLTKDERNEQNRLQGSLSDLENEARKLKSEMRVLRKQMVALDKRKTYLEAQLHN